jgi:hypothetical protein
MTLIELIVVITVLAVLATLVVVYVIPLFQDNKRVIGGVDKVTTALLIAKQRALRDQAPRGVRFIAETNPGISMIFTQMQYIEQPDPLSGGQMLLGTAASPLYTAGSTTLNFTNVDFWGGADPNNVEQFDVQPGDYFRVQGANYLIGSVSGRTQLTLGLSRSLTATIDPSYPAGLYQIIRQTRPINGEAPIKMPQNIVVDLAQVAALVTSGTVNSGAQVPSRTITNLGAVSPPTVTYYEVLFGPSGNVINFQGQSSPAIAIVIRDSTADPPPAGSPYSLDPNTTRVLGINPRTGMIAAQVIAPDSAANGMVTYALDGKSSGL